MKVGVTGSGGFVGKHVVAALAKGHTAIAFDRARLDLTSRPIAPGTFAGLDAVVHAAAYLPSSYADLGEAQRCMEINALGTLAVLQACVQDGVRKVIYLSTNLYRFSTRAADEEAAFEPSPHASSYLVSKAAADLFAQHHRSMLAVSILRLGSVYGPGLARGVIRTFADRLLARTPITVDDGGYQADFVAVSDVVDAILATIEHDVEGPFNIGSGVASRPRDIAMALADELSVGPELVQMTSSSRTEPHGFAALDIERARRLLDYKPLPLRDGLRSFIAWRRSEA